jgi:ribosomal protein L40E
MRCGRCGVEASPGARFCAKCGFDFGIDLVAAVCRKCSRPMPGNSTYCAHCGAKQVLAPNDPLTVVPAEDAPKAAVRPAPRREPPPPPAAEEVRPGGQSPFLALLFALLVPGAGQSYNGQPVKGFFLFFFSFLGLPYLYSLYDAYSSAAKLKAHGMSTGCSGFMWVGLQTWLVFNVLLLVAIGLTLSGVLS